MIERGDERQYAADRGQIQVAARLVRLRLDAELDVEALAQHMIAQEVQRIAEPARGVDRILAGVDLDALAAAPEDEDLGPEFVGDVETAHHLLRGEQAHGGVGAGEGAVLEHGMVVERVRGGHRGLDAGVGHHLLDVAHNAVALAGAGGEGDDVVVVELEAVALALGQSLDAFESGQFRARLIAERIAPAILQAPDAEGELVFFRRGERCGCHVRISQRAEEVDGREVASPGAAALFSFRAKRPENEPHFDGLPHTHAQ